MTENTTNAPTPKLTKSRKQKLVKGLTAGALAFGVLGVASFSAWTASQTFTVDSSTAESAIDSLEYSLDLGETWFSFANGTSVIDIPFTPLSTPNDIMYMKNMLPSSQKMITVVLRNNSTTNGVIMNSVSPHLISVTGEMFEGDDPVLLSNLSIPTYLGPGGITAMTGWVDAPDTLPESYSGTTGNIAMTLNYETSSSAEPGTNNEDFVTCDWTYEYPEAGDIVATKHCELIPFN